MLITENLGTSNLERRLADSLNYFLTEISGSIQLTPTQRQKAEDHYGAMADLLKNSPPNLILSKLDVKLIPFGGLGTDTAIRPDDGDSDLDLILRFAALLSAFGRPERLYGDVYSRLDSLPGYRDRLERKDRCVRVHYAGDFYLDLMSAAVEDLSKIETSRLWVPEWRNGVCSFVLTDPVGLMRWFETRCAIRMRVDNRLMERGNFEVMPLLSDGAVKPPLKQAVQLIKKARDEYFSGDDECRKILKSVVVLTVAGNAYAGEEDLYVLVDKILRHLDAITVNLATASVHNPVNLGEDFLEPLRKKPWRHAKLRKFLADTRQHWANLSVPGRGIDQTKQTLAQVFGERVTGEVLARYAERFDQLVRKERVRMESTGLLGVSATAGVPVRRHQFFGEE